MLLQNVDVIILSQSLISIRRAGPHRLATELRKNGYSCQIIDACWYFTPYEIKCILDICVGPDTKVIAWSSPYAGSPGLEQRGAAVTELIPIRQHEKDVIDHASALNNKIKFVVGGPSAFLRQKEPGINAIFYGMCDAAFVQYLKFLEGKNPFFQYTIQDDKMIVQGDSYNLSWNFNNSVIEYHPEDNLFWGDSVSIETARGCIFKCDFCAYPLNGKKNNEYIKYQQTLRQEFLTNFEQHGITSYVVSDDTFNDNLVKLQMIADIAQSLPFKLQLNCYIRIDLVRAHPLQYSLFAAIGLTGAFFGIESFNHESAKAIGKGLHPDKVIEELYKFNDKMPNCGTTGSFIIGLPYDTKETIQKQAEMILRPDFPLDALLMYPLRLNLSRKSNLSEFEKNTNKYFKTNVDDPSWWHNGNFDSTWANEFSNNFNARASQRQRIGGFAVATLHNYRNDATRPLVYQQSLAKKPTARFSPPLWSQMLKFNQYKAMVFDTVK